MKLMYEKVTRWKPGTTQTRIVFHIFDAANSHVLLGSTGSLAMAEGMVAGKIPLTKMPGHRNVTEINDVR